MFLAALQAHNTVGQHIFFNNISQIVGSVLAFFGQFIKPL